MTLLVRPARALLSLIAVLATQAVSADEAAIRKNLPARIADLPRIDEVRATPMPGLYEVRLGADVVYTDEQGDYLIQGQLIRTDGRTNLTQARIAELTRFDFKSLPLQDAIVWKQGSGEHKIAVFADPNCGYCKRFEAELQKVKDVTVYTFLFPVLGGDSPQKANQIWCAKDSTQAWRAWMLHATPPPTTQDASAPCDTAALQRNLAFGRAHKINGTPGIVFEDGHFSPGVVQAEQLEKQLARSPGGAG